MSFLKNCRCVRVFGNEEFLHSDVLRREEYFYIAYDGMCFDRDGFTIISSNEEGYETGVYVNNEIIRNHLIDVKV